MMKWASHAGLTVVLALWCMGSTPPQSGAVSASEPTVASADASRPPDPSGVRKRAHAGALALIVLGLIAVVLVAMGLLMLVVRWSRRARRLRDEPVRTEMEDLWVAAGKKDLPPPSEEDLS